MLSGFWKISKSLHEHTIGSAINIPTRAYNVCADSDFVFDARPIAYPSFSPCQFSVHANPPSLYIHIYVCVCVYVPLFAAYFDCITFSVPLLPPVCRKNSIRFPRADFYFLEIFMPYSLSILSPLLSSFDRGLCLFRARIPFATCTLLYTIFVFVGCNQKGSYLFFFKGRRLSCSFMVTI